MAIDFSFPAWLRDQHSFADSLLKGAQVGAIIANNRYRNQALAAQAIEAERNYDLREKQLNAQIRTEDINYRLKSQLIEDSFADKATLTNWFSQKKDLPLEERMAFPPPENLRLPQSYGVVNQSMDNDRLAFQQSEKGRVLSMLSGRASKIPESYAYRFFLSNDPDEQIAILEEGEEVARTQNLELYQPREMTTAEGERLVYNPKTGSFRFAPEAIGDEVVTRPIPDEQGNTVGIAMRSGNKWIRVPDNKSAQALLEIKYRNLAADLSDVRKQKPLFGGNPATAKRLQDQEDAILKEMQAIESQINKPSTSPSAAPAIRKYNPATRKIE